MSNLPKNNIPNGLDDAREQQKRTTPQVNPSQTSQDTQFDGAYMNALDADATRAAESVNSVTKSSAQDSDAALGFREVRDKAALYGYGSIGRAAAKSDANSWYLRGHSSNDGKFSDQNSHRWAFDTNRADAQTGNLFHNHEGSVADNTTGKISKDLQESKRAIDKALEKEQYSKHISEHQIRRATHTTMFDEGKRKANEFLGNHGKGNLFKNPELDKNVAKNYDLLIAKASHDRATKKLKYYDQHAGGLKNTSKAWIREAYSDADAAKGYKVAKISYKVARGGAKAVGMTAHAAVQGGLSTAKVTYYASNTARDKLLNAYDNSVKKSAQKGKISAKEAKEKEKKINDARSKLKDRKKSVGGAIDNTKDKTRSLITDKGYRKELRGRMGNAVYKKLPSGLQRRIDGVRGFNQNRKIFKARISKKISQSAPMKVVRTPFQFLAGIKKAAAKIAIGFGILIMIDAAFVVIVGPILTTILAPLSVFDPGKVNAQEIIDEMAAKQNGYREIVQLGTSSKGYSLPSGWDITPDKVTINGSAVELDVSKYKSGNGYNFQGLSADPNKTNFTKDINDQSLSIWKATKNNEDASNPSVSVKSVPLKILASAALSGDEDIYVEDVSYDNDGNAVIDLSGKATSVVDVQANYEYSGSKSDLTLTEDKSGSYADSSGTPQNYNSQAFYKGIISLCTAFSDNETEDNAFFKKYCNQLFDAVMNKANIRVNVKYTPNPEKRIKIHITDPNAEKIKQEAEANGVTFDSQTSTALSKCKEQVIEVMGYDVETKVVMSLSDVGLPDQMALDGANEEWINANARGTTKYKREVDKYSAEEISRMSTEELAALKAQEVKWSGWTTEVDAKEWAVAMYEMDWSDTGISFPNDNMASLLSNADIEDIVKQIETNNGSLEPGQKEFLKFSMRQVGQFYYLYGGKVHAPGKPPAGLDCSGFVSYALWAGGLNEFQNRGAAAFGNLGSPFNGDFGSLKPGTIIARNREWGSATDSSNHVVIYLGKFKHKDDSEARHYCVECTTWGELSGVMLSSPDAMRNIATYGYAWYPNLNNSVADLKPAEGETGHT